MPISISSTVLSKGIDLNHWCYTTQFDDFFVVVGGSGNEGIANLQLGAKIADDLFQIYKENKEETPFIRLREALNEVQKHYVARVADFQLAVVTYQDLILYAGGFGNIGVLVVRDGRMASILPKSEKAGEVVMASGYLKSGDAVIGGTGGFLRLTLFKKEKLLSSTSSTFYEQVLNGIINDDANKGSLGCVLLSVHEDIAYSEDPLTADTSFLKPQTNLNVDLRERLLPLVDRLIALLPEKKIYLYSPQNVGISKRKVSAVAIGLVLICLLAVSVTVGLRKNTEKQKRAVYEERLTEARREFEEARALSSVNTTRARDLIMHAQGTVLGIQTEGVQDNQVDELLNQIKDQIGTVAGIYQEEPSLYLDLSNVSDGFKSADVSYSDGRMVILSPDTKKAISLITANKNTETFAVPQILTGPLSIAAYADHTYVLSSIGIWEIGKVTQKIIDEPLSADSSIKAYTGNIYLLNKDGIWRYPGLGGGAYAGRASWLAAGVAPDLTNILSWNIDGSIWLMDGKSHISKYIGGVEDNFLITKLDKPFDGKDMYTDENEIYLYILDAKNQRLLVFTKKGELKAQYSSGFYANVKRIIASEENRRIYLITDTAIYSVEMKHL